MAKEKMPAFQFYPGDWRKDPGVQALGYFERGVWLEILFLMHESDERGKLILNGRKMPEEGLARLLGLDKQTLKQTLTTLLEYGVASVEPDTGVIFSRRMVRDENLRKVRQEAGKKGGNPALVKQRATTADNQTGNQNPTPSSSSSSSKLKDTTPSVSPPSPKSKPAPDKSRGTRLPDDWTLPDDWAEWATAQGMTVAQVSDQEARFADYWHAVPGQKGRKADWLATWRNWIRKTLENNHGGNGGGNHPRDDRTRAQKHYDKLREIAEREEAAEASGQVGKRPVREDAGQVPAQVDLGDAGHRGNGSC